MRMAIPGGKTARPAHKPEVYWKLRSRTHYKDTPGAKAVGQLCIGNGGDDGVTLVYLQPKRDEPN